MQTKETLPDGWMTMAAFPPESCESYDVKLPDGSVQRAFWSGKAWWLQGRIVNPVGWRMSTAVAA